ncbi:hypothetical protein FOL47_000173 [Perkinsus chesapeaki]|uniref:Uncharacterized protein n=1 Tax=Perkinsus chesapeaki TaxID=330153 RepID=A0A7J6KX39_PERCH|nr:hypothetical protein FOL47_000173 [Perkinsus chesapeaki]
MTSACDVVEGKTGIRVLDDCPIPQLRQLHRSEQDGTLQNGNEKLAMVQPVDPLATEEFHSEGPAARAWLGDSGELIVSEFNKKRILKMGKDNKYKWAPLVGQRREAFFFQHNGKTLLFYFASTTKRKVYAILRKWKDYH